MAVAGTILDRGRSRPVGGVAWMDHQWGDFITLLGGGWDWFSVIVQG
jgi:predicted secreted hydrolase